MFKFILILLAAISTALASIYGQCTGRSGICIDTGTCTSYGGTYSIGNCPGDPEDVKCCDNIPCKSSDGRTGTCSFTCSGDTVSGQCPGGSDFTCCLGSTEGDYYGPCYGGGGACIKILILLVVKLVMFLVNAQEEQVLNAVLQEINHHGT